MKIVLLEDLGVAAHVLERHMQKLESMGHSFTAYSKNTDPQIQIQRSRDANVLMLANMPLVPAVLEEASHLKVETL